MNRRRHDGRRGWWGGLCWVVILGLPAWGQRIDPANLTIKDIDSALDRAVDRVLTDPTLQPYYTFRGESAYGLSGSAGQEARYEVGNHALLLWTLLASGETYQNPIINKRLNWVLSSDTPNTFDRGMRAQMLAELPFGRWSPWLKRDYLWLSGALTDGNAQTKPAEQGSFDDNWFGQVNPGHGDHANAQYGTLGLWGLQRAGYSVDKDVWQRIDAHWRATQQKTPDLQPAGWSLGVMQGQNADPIAARVSGPMTAGGTAILALTERYLVGSQIRDPGDNVSPHLRKGLAWMDANFTLADRDKSLDWFYYMYTVQRVGHATGYRSFNGIDWYRQITAEVLNQRQGDGTWNGPLGRQISTGFALLYLASARDPVAIAKLRIGESWNNRPHDLWNFCEYISDTYEYSTTWQIVTPGEAVYTLIESPILYLSVGDVVQPSEAQLANLRAYLDAGGLLVTNVDGKSNEARTALRKLTEQLAPGREVKDLPEDHPLVGLHQSVRGDAAMTVVDNGLRPLILNFKTDASAALQSNDRTRSSIFRALSNVYLYTIGMNPRRSRLESNFVVQTRGNPAVTLPAARVRYEGDYDPEPNAMRQLKALLANKASVNLRYDEKGLAPSALGDAKIAFLTTRGQGQLSAAEAEALRKWVEKGGTLWLDAAGGSPTAVEAARGMLSAIAPGQQPVPLGQDHPVIDGSKLRGGASFRRVQYRFYTLRQTGPNNAPRVQAVFIDNRPAILYSEEDLTCGLAGLEHWGIYGYTVESARGLVLNSCLNALK